MSYDYEVVIVGAGPAGVTAGYILAKKGYKVLLLDKEKFPRKKLCGGALTAKTSVLLERIFKEPVASLMQKKIIDFKSRRYEIRYKNKILLNKESAYSFHFVDRYVYDNFFLNKAKEAGAEVMEGEKVEDVDFSTNRLLTSAGKDISAGTIIAADGANSVLRAKLSRENKLDGSGWQHNLAYAVEESLHRGGDCGGIDYPVLSFGYLDYGYAWLFPNRDRLVAGIGGLKRKDTGKNLARCFKTFLADFELNGRDSIKIQGHPLPFGNFLRKPVYEKILLVGDAAGLVDPLLGEGIYQAHRSGELAAQAVIENKNSDGAAIAHNYLDLLNTHLLPEFLWARRYRWFAYNRLNHIFKFRSVKLVEGRFDKLVELIHGVRSYKRPWLEKTEYI